MFIIKRNKIEKIFPNAAFPRTLLLLPTLEKYQQHTNVFYMTQDMKKGNIALKRSAEYFLTARVVFSIDSISHPSLTAGEESALRIPLEDKTCFEEAPSFCPIAFPRIRIFSMRKGASPSPALLHPIPQNIKANMPL